MYIHIYLHNNHNWMSYRCCLIRSLVRMIRLLMAASGRFGPPLAPPATKAQPQQAKQRQQQGARLGHGRVVKVQHVLVGQGPAGIEGRRRGQQHTQDTQEDTMDTVRIPIAIPSAEVGLEVS